MNHRIERSIKLLEAWAFSKFQPQNIVDIDYNGSYTSESVLCDFNMLETRTYRSTKRITARATETRSSKGSSLPIGGESRSRSVPALCKMVDTMFKESFSKRQLILLIALFAPASCLQLQERTVTDAKIGRLVGFKPARVCQLKAKAIELVARELFTPEAEEVMVA